MEELAPEYSSIISEKNLDLPSLPWIYPSNTGGKCIDFYFLVIFTIWLILFNPCLASVILPCISALLWRFPLALSRPPPILRFWNLKLSCYYSDLELCTAVALARLCDLRTYSTVLATRAFSSWPLDRSFFAPLNRTSPDPLLWTVDQVDFIALACACIVLHEFMFYTLEMSMRNISRL